MSKNIRVQVKQEKNPYLSVKYYCCKKI